MGKRSNFERNPRDYYKTPYKAVLPLLPYLSKSTTFIEPCAGDGSLIRHLEQHGHKCVYACDIEPQGKRIMKQDILQKTGFPSADFIITNTPWHRPVLHQMIDILRKERPSWILLDANWMFTKQAKPYLKFCSRIISVGRVSWMENDQSGKDDSAWFCFQDAETSTTFLS